MNQIVDTFFDIRVEREGGVERKGGRKRRVETLLVPVDRKVPKIDRRGDAGSDLCRGDLYEV